MRQWVCLVLRGKAVVTALLCIICFTATKATAKKTSSCLQEDGYSMYVWTNGFDVDAPHCNGVYPVNRAGANATCFNHNWQTPTARQKLWSSTVSLPQKERRVTRIFLADVKTRIENGGLSEDGTTCDAALQTLLKQAHKRGVEVYALFAASDEAFSKKNYGVLSSSI